MISHESRQSWSTGQSITKVRQSKSHMGIRFIPSRTLEYVQSGQKEANIFPKEILWKDYVKNTDLNTSIMGFLRKNIEI